MSFLDELQKNTNLTSTENGAVTNKSTLDPLLDFFSLAGAMRDRQNDAVKLFEKAYFADKLGAIRTLFYLRDIRGGQGERTTFRSCLAHLRTLDEGAYKAVLRYVPEYGRWDDLLADGVDATTVALIRSQLEEDTANLAEGKSVSLLAKWLPSENTSSKKSSAQAKALAKALEFKPSQYRKTIVALRKHIKLLEQKMSGREWETVEYGALPGQAHRKHVKAFRRHDEERYNAYLVAAEKGGAKLNASTLYTYEVFDTVGKDVKAANAMWANLPDYTNGTNALVMADVSGSMSGRPMSVSVSLALYFAERNTGPFNGYFMTFSATPQLVKVQGNNLETRLRNIQNAEWGMNTNLEAAFDRILDAAKASGASVDDMPKVLYIISDMEFDQASSSNVGYSYWGQPAASPVPQPSDTLFAQAKIKFEAAGYQLPHVVFWNVDARNDQAPATKFDGHVTLISGSSQSTFRYAVDGKSPVELMHEVINGERYKQIVI